jgi:hypothetical protein
MLGPLVKIFNLQKPRNRFSRNSVGGGGQFKKLGRDIKHQSCDDLQIWLQIFFYI